MSNVLQKALNKYQEDKDSRKRTSKDKRKARAAKRGYDNEL